MPTIALLELFRAPHTKLAPEVGSQEKHLPSLFSTFFQDCQHAYFHLVCFQWPGFPKRAEDALTQPSWFQWAIGTQTDRPSQEPSRFPGVPDAQAQVLWQKGCGCIEASVGLRWGPRWVLSFLLVPSPCPQEPGHKAMALKHTESSYLLELVRSSLGGNRNHQTGRNILKALNLPNIGHRTKTG